MRLHLLALATALLSLTACDKGTPEPRPEPPSTARPAAASSAVPPATRISAPARIVAIGDLHGDLEATRATLRLAGAIDDKDKWIGGDLMVVQTGDEIDRGDDDKKILDLFDRLAGEAKAAGGAVIALAGNHEVMNVQLDFRYVSDGAYRDFNGASGALLNDPRLSRLPGPARDRGAAFLPGGQYAKMLAKRGAIAIVGDTVFLHGGLTPKWVRQGIDKMNRDLGAWMDGASGDPPAFATAEDGPLWSRRYSAAPDASDCKVLEEALALIPAKRMVVGHTVQRGGISAACNEQVWRIDVGLSKVYGGKPEVLEIKGAAVRAIR